MSVTNADGTVSETVYTGNVKMGEPIKEEFSDSSSSGRSDNAISGGSGDANSTLSIIPKTGDTSTIKMLTIVLLIAVGLLSFLLVLRKKLYGHK